MPVTFDPFLGQIRKKDVKTNAATGDTSKFLNEKGEFIEPSGLNVIRLGACSSLGQMLITGGTAVSWIDPDNVVLNDSVIAEWDETVLVRKEGTDYPTDVNDGVVLARTSRTLGNKNYYRDTNFEDKSQVSGTDYTYMLFSKTVSGVWNNLVANRYSGGTGLSWSQIQQFVRAGRGAELFPVGTVFVVPHPEYESDGVPGIAFRVAGHDQVPAADESLSHTMCLEMVDILFNAQYDAPESLYVFTADTTAQANKSYYVYENSAYTKLVEGTDYEIGDAVPVASWFEKNNNDRASYGNNFFPQSNELQWANASGGIGQWFEKQNIWDVCSSGYSGKNGFLKYLDSAFLLVVKEAKLITAKANVDGGGSVEVKTAKFWPLSQTQVFGTANNGITENVRLQYYADGGSAIKKPRNSASAGNWWLRSPYTNFAYFVCNVTASGASNYANANTTYGVSLACIIA